MLDTLSQDYLSYISNLVKNNKTPLKKKNSIVEEDLLNEKNKNRKTVRDDEFNQSKSLPSHAKNGHPENSITLKSGLVIAKMDKKGK